MTLAVPLRTNIPRPTKKDSKDTPDRVFNKLAWGFFYRTEGVQQLKIECRNGYRIDKSTKIWSKTTQLSAPLSEIPFHVEDAFWKCHSFGARLSALSTSFGNAIPC
jgi:hypothetical protein